MAAYAYINDWHGKQVFTLATKTNLEAMERAARVVELDVKRNFTEVGSADPTAGQRISVRKTKSGKRHYRSLPGEPPAVDTGTLRASIMSSVALDGVNVVGKVGPDVEVIAQRVPVGTDVEYGLYLELGTNKMKPRPYLRPALARTQRRVNRIFKAANGK